MKERNRLKCISVCVCVFETEAYKEGLSACMSELGHCSRKSDLNTGHPENIYATAA